jgi:hypothetical protein
MKWSFDSGKGSREASDLQRTIDERELQLDLAIGLCSHCGAVNLLPGFSRVEAFVCQTCGKGNG